MFHIAISPLGIALGLAAVRIAGARWMGPVPRHLLHAGIALCIVLMTPLGANLLVRWVEGMAPQDLQCDATAPPDTIVLLSGGTARPPRDAGDFSALNATSLQRLSSAIDLWRRHPQSRLVISGGGVFATKESTLLGDLAWREGIPRERIVLEQASQSTWENATQVAALQPAVPRRIWLVTSALHLPRAAYAFRQEGFQPCSAGAYSIYLPPGGFYYYLPQRSALQKSEESLHELAGMLAYRWAGHTESSPVGRTGAGR